MSIKKQRYIPYGYLIKPKRFGNLRPVLLHYIKPVFGLSWTCLISFQHVRREGNNLAHALARRAVLSADIVEWVEELPTDLEDVFQMDLVDL